MISVAGVIWQVAVAQIPGREGHYGQWLPGYLPWFMVGLAFAAVSASLAAQPRKHVLDRIGADLAGCWILAVAVFALACSPLAGPRLLLTPTGWEAGAKVILYAIAGAFFVLPLVFGPEREGSPRRVLCGPVPFWLGEISYGIFCIHMIVLNQVFLALDLDVFTGRFLTVALLTIGVTVVLATISFYFFEKPILRLKNVPAVRAHGAAPRHRDRAGGERDRSVTHVLERPGQTATGLRDAVAPRGDRRRWRWCWPRLRFAAGCSARPGSTSTTSCW